MLNFVLDYGMLVLIYVALFVLGGLVGSFLNVLIARLPLDKSNFWPRRSYCGNCLQQIRWYDNIPIVSYLVLGGKCRSCGSEYSVRYFAVELLVAAAFPLMFYLEIVKNIHGLPAFNNAAFELQHNVLGR